ncbi:hypothetical protein [Candidatus Nitronereus thalassa]|uniref:DUF1795 domain-containing protein n=1 Tax=Candidatus Nitronereus thalassa TaxID=3020898 RepID=A0ABU3K5C3_9BACT|nr:hypothetical protein [Candidatus Nitronereus thalassa]MDT7041614.1 hypothetical protein [Candidatus Nitronereus thalassa]
MELLILSLLIFLLVGGLLAFTLGGGQSTTKTPAAQSIAYPPGFSPRLAFKEKYGDTGIAYDENQKSICILQPEAHLSQIISYQNILAVALFEDNALIAKSVRGDEPGKQLLNQILTENIKPLFQDPTEQQDGQQQHSPAGTSSTLQLRVLVNNREHPVHQINFLNMEAKKGGVIYNEAMGHGKNWQDLLSHLIRMAGKPIPSSAQPPSKVSAPSSQPNPETAVTEPA